MIVLADTHALVWWLTGDASLSRAAEQQLDQAEADQAGGVLVSVATRIDLHYLVHKNKMPAAVADQAWQLTGDATRNIRAVPVTTSVVDRFGDPMIMASPPKDPVDRILMATALELRAPLVTRDGLIQALAPHLGLTTIW